MPKDSSSHFNLAHLRKDAKRWLRACRTGDAEAQRSVRAVLSRAASLDGDALTRRLRLADVQHAMALQRGFASWAELTRFGDPLARLLATVRGGHLPTLRRELAGFRGLSASNVYAAAALGDAAALQLHLDRDPSLATASRDGWTALDYACSSPLGRLSARHATGLTDCAERLLEAGADPASAVEDGRLPGPPVGAMMRAMLSGNASLAVLLRKYGAEEPRQQLQAWIAANHAAGAASLHEAFNEYFRRPEMQARLREGLEAFKARGGVGIQHASTDPREFQHLRMPNMVGAQTHLWEALLDRGYDPAAINVTGRTALHTLVTYAPASLLQVFLDRGVSLTARDGDGRSVVAAAVRAGNAEAANLLRARGVVDDATWADRLIGACLADDAEGAQAIAADHPETLDTLTRSDADEFVRAAARGAITQVRLMLACGFPPDLVGEAGATALHQAAWRGQVATVEFLLAHGASPLVRDDLYGDTAVEWARHGAMHAEGAEGPCLEAATLLEAAARRRQ
jgi:ankyrin repeat protein